MVSIDAAENYKLNKAKKILSKMGLGLKNDGDDDKRGVYAHLKQELKNDATAAPTAKNEETGG